CGRSHGDRADNGPPPSSDLLEADLLRTLPEHGLAEQGKVFETRRHGDEMIAGELAHLAREMHAAIGEQDLGFADAAGIKDDLAGRAIACIIFVSDAEIETAERHPNRRAAPAHVNDLALERHCLAKRGAG